MKTIHEYIEGLEPGDTVPSISGEIVDLLPPDDRKQTQIIRIQSEQRIKVYIKDAALWITDAAIGDTVSFVCKKSSGSVKGITLKESSGGNKYITISAGASVSITKADNGSSDTPVEKAVQVSAADLKIESYALDRLYIFREISKIVNEFNADSKYKFPEDKVAELATGCHITLERTSGIVIRPTDKQLERKNNLSKASVTEPKKKESPKGEPKSALDWRSFKHPKTGELLGDASIEKIKTHLAPWYYRTSPPSDNPQLLDYHRHVGACVNEMTTPHESFDAYLNDYAEKYAPNSMKKRTEAIVKFANGIKEKKIIDGNILDLYTPTKSECITLFREFSKLWKELVETEE